MHLGLGELLALCSAATWALGVILYRRLGATLAPLTLNFLKNGIVLGVLLPITVIAYLHAIPKLSLAETWLALVSGVLGIGIADTLYFSALNAVGAGRMGIIGNFYSPFVLGLSFVWLGERLNGVQWIGFALVLCGVLVVARPAGGWRHLDNKPQRRGALLGVAAVLLMATAIVMVKPVLERQPLLWVTVMRMLGGLLGMVLIAALRGELRKLLPARQQRIHWPTLWVAALVGQCLSMLLWLGGYKYAKASVAAVLNETASVFILLFAALWLHEPLTRRGAVGVTLTMAGVACMLTQRI